MDRATPVYTGGMWNRLKGVKHVLCSDGKRRYATITSEPDTFFSVPASVNVNGMTVSGFVYTTNDDYHFVAYTDRKNGHMLPEWPH